MCLLLGIVTTVGVAWGCWIGLNPRGGTIAGSFRWENSDSWSYWVFQTRGATLVQRIPEYADWMSVEHKYASRPQLPRWSQVRRRPTTEELKFTGSIVEDARGWPILSLYSESRIPAIVVPFNRNPFFGMTPAQIEKGSIPNRPIWSGLAADTALFTSIWALPILLPPLLRRWTRRRRGACGSCGYDLRFTPHCTNCPECGTGLRAAAIPESSIAIQQS